MAKKLLGLLTAVALVGGVLSAATVSAQEAPATAIPEVVNIEDPAGDANYLNGQGLSESQGDNVTGEDVGSLSDILKVWFTSDAESVKAHVVTEGAPSGQNASIFFRVMAGPNGATANCLRFQGATAGLTSTNDPFGSLRDLCDGDTTYTEGIEFTIETGPDDVGIYTISVPRSVHPALVDGTVLAAPTAHSRNYLADAVTAPQIDNTKPGTDFTITPGGGGGPVVEEPPVDPPKVDPPVKKGCKKGKGKKKGCKKRACPTFTPAEAGAEAESTVVTDKATEEAPIEIPIPTEAGLPVASSHVFHNLQVDSKAKSAGLYVRYEFEPYEDLDLYLLNTDGSTAAQAAGFNPFPFIPNNAVFFTDGTGTGGHSELGAEQVDGVLTPDCGGYTADLAQYLAEGGERVLKVWLGPATWDPVAQAPIEDEG